VKLSINIDFFGNVVFAGYGGTMIPSAEAIITDSAESATRRAIVSAAAEIGKELA
jgi:hypothetical protein